MNQEIIRHAKVMQLATIRDGRPWVCTVYFVLYNGCFYWLSFPDRRHSQDIAASGVAAIAIALKQDMPVIGLQAEGEVMQVTTSAEVKAVTDLYTEKYDQGHDFFERFEAGTNRHVLYRFTPRHTVIFDELNHPGDAYQKIAILE